MPFLNFCGSKTIFFVHTRSVKQIAFNNIMAAQQGMLVGILNNLTFTLYFLKNLEIPLYIEPESLKSDSSNFLIYEETWPRSSSILN